MGENVTEPLAEVTRAVLFDEPLATRKDTSHVEARRIRMGPGVAPGAHVHNGPVVGNIVEGSVVFQVEDGPASPRSPFRGRQHVRNRLSSARKHRRGGTGHGWNFTAVARR
jgi:hypothetical protein